MTFYSNLVVVLRHEIVVADLLTSKNTATIRVHTSVRRMLPFLVHDAFPHHGKYLGGPTMDPP